VTTTSQGPPDLRQTSTLTVGEAAYRVHPLAGVAPERLPYTLRIVLENLLRHEDGTAVTRDQIEALCRWGDPDVHRTEIALHPSRIFLHDTNGVPALVDLAAMRDAARELGADPTRINPAIPAELVVDHSVIADVFGRPDALERNVDIEYGRNAERYRFLKWGQAAFDGFAVVPPGTGIMHQINLEYLARVVMRDGDRLYPDLCLGTDSHTTMVDGLGVLGWGIGGIEAEAAMLGEPVSMLVPKVVGVRLRGGLPAGATATDLVLTLTEVLRRHGVVGTFVEFHGEAVTRLPVADRATIANMCPEFGATCAYFPIDAETVHYLRFTGRDEQRVAEIETYARTQGLWHDPERPKLYSEDIEFDLGSVVPSLAGPRRPQDRVPLDRARSAFHEELRSAPARGPVATELDGEIHEIGHGSVAIAAITSCTNTSNPAIMTTAGLLARNAVRRGLRRRPWVKTTLSPGSRVVTDYLERAGVTPHLDELGFHLTGYGCMTCIGASGPLIPEVATAVAEHDLSVVSVLSGNRNFEGRINPDVRMNYLASPPLVVAYAIAGTMDIDLHRDPLGFDADGAPVLLRDIWPDPHEVRRTVEETVRPETFADVYADVFTGDRRWRDLDAPTGETFAWDPGSTYVRRPPYLDGMSARPSPVTDIVDARTLLLLGDSITTDHMSPAGAIPRWVPAALHLFERGVDRAGLNTYASRRGNHDVMMRGCFANIRLRNRLVPDREGGWSVGPDGEVTDVHDAATAYGEQGTPVIIVAGREYGTGSSRDWAAKGPALLGVRAVLAESYERIHRSNLIGMGVLPLQFREGESAVSLGLTGHEAFSITGLTGSEPGRYPTEVDVQADDLRFRAVVRLDTVREQTYHRHGGILPYVTRSLVLDDASRTGS
jgi:aconitate hydratase